MRNALRKNWQPILYWHFLSKSIGVVRPYQPHSDGIRIAIRWPLRNARQLTGFRYSPSQTIFELNVIYERGHLKPCLHSRLPEEPVQPVIHLYRNSLKFRERKIVRILHDSTWDMKIASGNMNDMQAHHTFTAATASAGQRKRKCAGSFRFIHDSHTQNPAQYSDKRAQCTHSRNDEISKHL